MRKLRNTIRDVTQAANTATKVSRAIMSNNPALARATKRTLLSTGSNLGRLGGGMISPAAAVMGARIGSGVAERISRLIGSGDYAIAETPVVNSLFKGSRGSGPNTQSTFGDASIRMRHREYIQDIIAPSTATNFSIAKFHLNPGLTGFAPLISQIAANYEEYIVHGLVYEFKSGTSPYLSTSAMGTCVMAVEFNPDSPDYQSKLQIENSECAISFRPDQSAIYGVECARNRTSNFLVRNDNRTTNLPSYDFGKMYFATALGSSSYNNAVLGELWVSYDIELIKPRLSKLIGGNLKISSSTGVVAATPIGTTRSITFATGKLWNATCSSSVVTLPINAGDYFDITLIYFGTVAGAVAYTATLANANAYTNVGGGASYDIIAPVSGTSTTTSMRYISAYAATSANPTNPVTLTIGGATLPTGSATVDILVTLYSSGIGN